MKTMKRVLSLVLAVLTLAAILAIPAAAEPVVCRTPAMKCPYCIIGDMTSVVSDGYYVYICNNCGATMWELIES